MGLLRENLSRDRTNAAGNGKRDNASNDLFAQGQVMDTRSAHLARQAARVFGAAAISDGYGPLPEIHPADIELVHANASEQ